MGIQKIDETPGELTITTPDQGQVVLKRNEVIVGNKALGVKNRHGRIETDNIQWFREKAAQWADKRRTGYLNETDGWKAFITTIAKSVEYPLAATCFTKIQCNTIMLPVRTGGLRASNMQSKFPLQLVYGPLDTQGLGFKLMYILQLIEHIQMIMRHIDNNTLTGKLMRNSLEAISLETR